MKVKERKCRPINQPPHKRPFSLGLFFTPLLYTIFVIILFTILPAGCDLYKPVKKPSINTADNGDGTLTVKMKAGTNSVIFYTTNGSSPTVKDELYKGEFSINQGTTVRAIAVCPSGRKSEIDSFTFSAGTGPSGITADNIPCFTD